MPTDLHHRPTLIDTADPAPAPAPIPSPGPPTFVQLADWLLRSPCDAPPVAAYRRCTAELMVGAASSAEPVEPPWWQELGADWAVEVWLDHHDPETT